MQEIFETILSICILSVIVIYEWHKLQGTKVNWRSYKIYLIYIIFIILSFLGSSLTNAYIRMPILLVIWTILYVFLFNVSIREALVSVIEVQIITLILEVICMIFLMGVLQIDIQVLQSNLFLKLLPNLGMGILTYIVFLFKFPIYIRENIIKFIKHLNSRYVALYLILLMICINVMMAVIYYENTTIIIIIMECIILSIYTVISILMLKEKNTSEIYRIGYEEQQKALQDNVLLLDQECMKNHENVNQLYTIEGLARNNDTKGILEYIGVVIKEKKQEDNTLTRRIKRIPLATIQGLIYPKLGIMKDNDIDFQVVLARNIKEFDFTKVDMKTNMELCKILGVLIDNAIDEVTKLEDRKIKLELFCKNGDLHIDVSNNYGKFLDNMDEVGVTSKEGLHGYGLGIIAQITKQNPKLQNQKNINANRFHQIVIVSNSIDNKKKNV